MASIHQHEIPEQQISCKCKGVPRQRSFVIFLKVHVWPFFLRKRTRKPKKSYIRLTFDSSRRKVDIQQMMASIHQHEIPEQQISCKCKGVPRQRSFVIFLKVHVWPFFLRKRTRKKQYKLVYLM